MGSFDGLYSRVLGAAFSVVFCSVALFALVSGVVSKDWSDAAIGLAMLASGLFVSAFLGSSFQITPGRFVGGGIRTPRVALLPGEQVRSFAEGSLLRQQSPISVWTSFWHNAGGYVVATDRRVIFLPFRFFGAAATDWIALADVGDVAGTRRTSFAGSDPSELTLRTGDTVLLWSRSRELLATVAESSANAPTLDVGPVPSQSIVKSIAVALLGATVSVVVLLVVLGVPEPSGPKIFLALFLIGPVSAAWSIFQVVRDRHHKNVV